MLLTGCASTKIIVDKVFIPELTFPEFPLADEMKDNRNGTVSVPASWIVQLEDYHIRIQETEDKYLAQKEIYKRFYRGEK